MKKKLCLITFAFVLAMLSLCGCGKDEIKVDSTGEFYLATTPSDEDKKEIDEVLGKFIKFYEENRAKEACALFTEEFSGGEEDLASFFTKIHEECKNPFVPFDGYYISGVTPSDLSIKIKHKETDGNYMEIVPGSDELYYGLYVSEGEKTSYMLSLSLTKESGDWKIAWVNPGEFKYHGKDADAIFEKTLELYGKDDIMSSYIYSCMLSNTFRPGGFYRYAKDAEMEDMCYKLFAEIDDKFALPLDVENTNNSTIHSILITKDKEKGMMPMFVMRTDTSIEDKDALEAEAKAVAEELKKLSPGLSENFEFATFNVTNENVDKVDAAPKSVESIVISLR